MYALRGNTQLRCIGTPWCAIDIWPSSLKGPVERRFLISSLCQLQVLKKENPGCAPEDQAFVRALLHDVVQLAASGAYDIGRRHDFAYARAYLAQLIRLLPREHYPILAFLALHCPPSLVERARALLRAIRTMNGAR